MSELPSVFQNKIDHDINTSQNVYHRNMNEDRSINLNDIFKGSNFIYKKRVDIYLKDNKVLTKDIISKTDKYLITIDNEKILIDDIKDIKEK